MKTELGRLPFSRAGSYMAISELDGVFRGESVRPGLYLRTVHGGAHFPLIAEIIPLADGKKCDFEDCRIEWSWLDAGTKEGKIEMCFDDADTLLIRGQGEKTGLLLDFLADKGSYDYIYEIPYNGKTFYMANCYKNNCRYLIKVIEGEIKVEQEWKESSALYARIRICGAFFIVIKEIRTEWDRTDVPYNFEECRHRTDEEFRSFCAGMPSCPDAYLLTARKAAYLDWSGIVKKNGFLRHDAMLMSKNWMCSVWSWDHCFNAIALCAGHPELAWEQFMIQFDHQDRTGLIPDSINDAHMEWNYCKPPIHGWALRWMRRYMKLNDEQKQEAYRCLKKWTQWWLIYRDYDGEGLCEYNHGNDSGWDNSTAFSVLPPVMTPELQAFLIIQMEVLSDLAGELNMKAEQEEWSVRSNAMLERLLDRGFVEDLPVVRTVPAWEVVPNDSLLPYVCLVLGKRLPEKIRNRMVKELKSNRFYTQYGFATESPGSEAYRPDGYWRGPIWAPSTMLILDGLAQCGEIEFVRETSRRFADMVSRSGFAENFDALTGAGLRDRAYTWTSSVFLILAHEYLTD